MPDVRARSSLQRRWMMFVDGENFTIEGQKLAQSRGLELSDGPHWMKDVYLWFPGLLGRQTSLITRQVGGDVSPTAIRAHYYTTVTAGNDTLLSNVKRALWDLEFQPEVFKKHGQKSKRVDITL